MTKVLVDSGCCLSPNIIRDSDIGFLKTFVSYKGKTYLSDSFWTDFSPKDFSDYIREGNCPDISQPPIGLWIDQIKSQVPDNVDKVIYVSMSKSLSGAVRAFNIVKNILKDDRLNLIESKGAGSICDLTVLKVLDAVRNGQSVENTLSDLNKRLRLFCISESFMNWSHTGRSSGKKTDYVPEGCPLMSGREDGSIRPLFVGRTVEESLDRLSDEVRDLDMSECVINHTYGIDPNFLEKFKKIFTDKGCRILTEGLSNSTVTSVTGLGSVDVSFI